MSNIFEGSCTEEGTGSRKGIFEGGSKFSASKERKNFYGTASEAQREEDWPASPSNQEHQSLEGKLKHRVKQSII